MGESRGGERKKRRSGILVLEVRQTDTSLLMVVCVCSVSVLCVFRKQGMCFFLVWLIKAFGLSIRLDGAEFLSPSICIVGPLRPSCCSQSVKRVTLPEANTTHKTRDSYYSQSLLCCCELLLQILFECLERMDDFILGIFMR